MRTWRVTFPDGSFEDVTGDYLNVLNGVLTISGGTSFRRTSKSWPLTSVRSWEQQ